MDNNLLEVRNLTVAFEIEEGSFKAVDNISFNIKKGEILGLVGESGCGKSVTAMSILKLLPSPPAKFENGEILFKNKNLLGMNSKELQGIRGKDISMIFQEPLSSLSPLRTIADQMIETINLHRQITHKKAWKIVENWLKKVKIPDASHKMSAYPFQLSGGMRQRVMIAMALMLNPNLIIADEPTTALDVTVQAQIFELMRENRQDTTSIFLITHDMGVIWDMCDRVIVMYASKIVEEGTLNDIFKSPSHPYTKGLLDSIPKSIKKRERLTSIPGNVPSPFNYPQGCHFSDRCPYVFERCKIEDPKFINNTETHKVACFKPLVT
ncbi:MAG: ABC transporter ATP-binding protein [Desulfobacterales bacterium]|nr:ABC transporter ATP-binding protein [Desulfobacterales bacterium]MBF0398732.1 ABC transporter ATP-binding protein [Desulfobacterales bacterium]